MIIALANDHRGLEYKNEIKKHLEKLGHTVIDYGTDSKESCHYPVFVKQAAEAVSTKKADFGIVICSSGEGVSIAANKVKGIRCGIAYNDDVARLMREHNNANMIAFAQDFMNLDDVLNRVDVFLNTEFLGGKHQTRIDLISSIEENK